MNGFANPLDTWNQRFASDEYIFGKLPNHYLLENFQSLNRGPTLAIADGEGRNSVWLAGQGLPVDAFDFAPNAIDKARAFAASQNVAVNFQCSDWQSFDWKTSHYDNVVGVFFQFANPQDRARIFELIDACLKPGGVVLIQGYSPAQLQYNTGGPGRLENLYDEACLRSAFANYKVLDLKTYEREIHEGHAHAGMSGLIGIVAQKP